MKQDSINSTIFLQNDRSNVLNNHAVNYIEFHSGHLTFATFLFRVQILNEILTTIK